MLGEVEYTLTSTSGSYVNGEWVSAAKPATTVRGSLQPLNRADLQRLPEGLRVRARFKFYTTSDLRTSGSGDTYEPDVVTVNSLSYEVHGIDDYTELGGHGLQHNMYVLLRPER
jgi:hypothetical protein